MNDLIAEARELCEKATPGPWKVVENKSFAVQSDDKNIASCFRRENEEFIARSRTLVPALCDALEAERAWIPVTEMLPEELETFIGWHKDGFVVLTTNYFDELEDITHWMPLPEGPEKGESDGR